LDHFVSACPVLKCIKDNAQARHIVHHELTADQTPAVYEVLTDDLAPNAADLDAPTMDVLLSSTLDF
jgi:hypothetical protein